MNLQSPEPFDPNTDAVNDPALDALLDETLAPDEAPADLEQGVLAAVRAAQADQAVASGPVLARIGFRVAWAAAAVLVLGTALVTFWSTQQDNATPGDQLAGNDPTQTDPLPQGTEDVPAVDPQLAALEAELADLEMYSQTARTAEEVIDGQLALLDTQVALTASEALWVEGDGWDSVGFAVMQSDLDALAFPIDSTF